MAAADFEPLVDERTRLVSVAWVSHQNGFRHDMRPLADLAHATAPASMRTRCRRSACFPSTSKPAASTAIATGTYKWLLGSFGVAPFYVRREILDRITPDRMGALHVERELPDHRYEIYKTAKKFDYATLAFGPVYQLGAALDYLERVGVARIEAHTVSLGSELATGLRSIGIEVLTPAGNRSSIVSFRNPADAGTTRAALEAARTQVSLRQAGAEIRVSPALFNTSDDIRRFLDIAATLKARSRA